MNTTVVYITVAISLLLVIAILVFVADKEIKKRRLTPLASLAFGLIVAGIIFGEERVIGYGLLATGVIFAVMDLLKKHRTD